MLGLTSGGFEIFSTQPIQVGVTLGLDDVRRWLWRSPFPISMDSADRPVRVGQRPVEFEDGHDNHCPAFSFPCAVFDREILSPFFIKEEISCDDTEGLH